MKVLICGSRTWDKPAPIRAVLNGLMASFRPLIVIDGGAPGADRIAHDWTGFQADGHECYPADWEQYGKAAGHIRNQQMLDEGDPDVVFAFVDKPLEESKGTHNMVSRAREADVPVYVTQRLT